MTADESKAKRAVQIAALQYERARSMLLKKHQAYPQDEPVIFAAILLSIATAARGLSEVQDTDNPWGKIEQQADDRYQREMRRLA